MATAVGSDLSLQEIAVSHRVGKPRSSDKPRDILVKFISRRSRDKLLKKRSLLKSNGYEGIFVNEDLTKYRSELLFEAKQLVKRKHIIGAWSTDGTILVKVTKDKKVSVHRIHTKRDINRFLSYTVAENSNSSSNVDYFIFRSILA
ncbi:uncharacterized protein LOC128547720 [Mercenaria mercenaria]|uniref:uncharacterized protein LOC128547720 n=1 Tax=Mercenaria mercenaria TaxID=6596 RepID=UPI00234F763D|nr:uncharacterized protein LOC128547720 [Mercenaria mercenaria]